MNNISSRNNIPFNDFLAFTISLRMHKICTDCANTFDKRDIIF